MKAFAHLHCHTSASLLDGVISPERLLEAARDKGISAIALTDHGNMASHLPAEIESKNIENCPKVIYGSELYVVPDRIEKEGKDDRLHLVLLAKNEEGYRNLMKINNEAWRCFYYRPRIDFDFISKHHKGLVALSACAKGIVAGKIAQQDFRCAIDTATRYQDLFGHDFYLEIQLINVDVGGENLQTRVNRGLITLSDRMDIPLVITNDVHYINEEDWILHEKMLHLSTGNVDWHFETKDIWLKTWDELNEAREEYFPDITYNQFKKAMTRTLEVAAKCDHHIKTGDAHIPRFDYTTHPEYKGHKTKEDFFIHICVDALREFVRANPSVSIPLYEDRLKKEVNDIIQMGAIDYFLIVEDLVRFIRGQGKLIMIRGSANGSLVCYLLKFGHIDPVKHHILFERFISPARVEIGMFDVDIDIDMEREMRPKAVQYLKEKYGESLICNVGSYGRLMWKAAIKDMGRVEGLEIKHKLEKTTHPTERKELEERLDQFSFKKINELTAMMERASQQEGGDISLEETIKNQPAFKEWYDANKEWVEKYVRPIVGLPKSPSIHPASVVILPGHMDEWLPIRSQASPQDKTKRVLCTQWEGSHTGREDLRTYGVMALDILGVKTLNVVADTIRMIERTRGIKIGIEDIPFDDPKTIEGFVAGETLGVFQLNAPGITRIVRNVKPDCFSDVVNLCAIDRPGPLSMGAQVSYAKRKHGHEPIEKLHKTIDPVMEDALGMPIFNDHIMMIAMYFAGFTPVEAEELRKVSKAKKGKESIAPFKEKFISQAVELHGEEVQEAAETMWEKIEQFGAYSFPKAHASGYGLVAWATMYLKTNFPEEFFCNLLNFSDHDKYSEVRLVAKREYGVRFVMPDVNRSKKNFIIDDGKIVWSLSGIKGLGPTALTNLIKGQPYSSFDDFYKRSDKRQLNKSRMEAVILSGCLRQFGEPLDLIKRMYELRNAEGKKGSYDPRYDEFQETDWQRSKTDHLGFQTISYFDTYGKSSLDMTRVGEITCCASGSEVIAVGQISNLRTLQSKRGPYLKGKLSDVDGSIDVNIWNEEYEKLQRRKRVPNDGDIILVVGTYKEWRDLKSIHVNRIKKL